MIAQRTIAPTRIDAEGFAPFGRVVQFSDSGGSTLVRTVGYGWEDAYTAATITRETPSLGMTAAPGGSFACTRMERHANIEEALLPAGAALVLAVAPEGSAPAPRAEDVRAFVIPPGIAVVLNPGVWHDACRGLEGPTTYYWLAATVDSGSSPWTEVVGGPVAVEVSA